MAKKKWVVDLDLNQNELQNPVLQNLASAPGTPKTGQTYFNTATNHFMGYNGTSWLALDGQGQTYTFGTGLTESSGTVTLNQATTSALGGVIVGTNISVNSGTISVADASESAKGVIEIASDAECETGTATTLAVNPKQLATKLNASLVGVASGVASLDSNGKVPTAQLPSFVDDVVDAYIVSGATALSAGWLSATSGGTALTPETDKIYVIVEPGSAYENKTYRWSGSTYVEISPSPAQATESTPGIAAIATQAECTTGTNDTKFVTPLKMATYTSGVTKKITATNGALTASGGVCTWSISNTLATADVIVSVYEVSTGDEVMCAVTAASGTITVKINSSSNISANTYKAVIIG